MYIFVRFYRIFTSWLLGQDMIYLKDRIPTTATTKTTTTKKRKSVQYQSKYLSTRTFNYKAIN